MSEKTKSMSLFEQLKSGLEDSIAYSKGELSLVTTKLPPPPPKASARDVQSLRKSLHMSQAVFAATLNVSPRTVQSWEQRLREPSDAALRMIQVVRVRPDVITMFFAPDGTPSATASTRAKRHRTRKATPAL